MKKSKKYIKKLKKRLLIGMYSVMACLILIVGSKSSLFSSPINVLKSIGNYISTAFYNDELEKRSKEISKTIVTRADDGAIVCDSIVQGVRDCDLEDGTYTFRVKGKSNEIEETIDYDVELINYYNDMIYSLEENETEKTISLGDSTTDYKMLVVKYHGNLTINKGVTLTANTVDNLTYKKGMYICVLGDINNEGTISMTARGTYNQEGENVYLWKNIDESLEYIPANGGTGGESIYQTSNGSGEVVTNGNNGANGGNRATGGGGSGGTSTDNGNPRYDVYSGSGSAGTSYSGGSGGGGIDVNWNGSSSWSAGEAEKNGGAGGYGVGIRQYPHWWDRAAGGGAGNLGGMGQYNGEDCVEYSGENGTGGLLILYADILKNSGTIEANGSKGGAGLMAGGGSSGGGSVNVFARLIPDVGKQTALGGEAVNGYHGSWTGAAGGAGGNGTVTINELGSVLNYPKKTLKLKETEEYTIDKEKLSYIKLNENQTEGVSLGNISFESLDNNVATVDKTGKITAKGIGNTKIKITDTENRYSTYIIVNVTKEGVVTPKIKAGEEFAIALKEDGTVWSWGTNENGQLGIGDNDSVEAGIASDQENEPVQVITTNGEKLSNIIDIGAGNKSAIALDKNGTVWTWGTNNNLDDVGAHSVRPAEVKELEKIVKVDCYNNNFYALDADGNAFIWGEGYNAPEKVNANMKILDIANEVLLGEDGRIYYINEPESPIRFLNSVSEISAGEDHYLFKTVDGHVYTVGKGELGQLGKEIYVETPIPNLVRTENGYLENVVEISAGNKTSMAITEDGKAYIWGDNENNKLGLDEEKTLCAKEIEKVQSIDGVELNINKVMVIETGHNSSYIADVDGYVYSVGLNTKGQLGNGTNENTNYFTLSSVTNITLNKRNEYIKIGESIDIDASKKPNFSLLIKNDETQSEWNRWTSSNEDVATVDENGNVTGVGIGHTTITAYNEKIGLKGRAIINVYRNKEGAITVPQVSHGDSFTAVLKEDGTVWTTGYGGTGQLGDGTNEMRNEAVQVRIAENTYLTNVRKISVGMEYASALTLDGKVYVWGCNDYGQLAGGDTDTQVYAKQAKIDENTYIENAIDISAGDAHLMILTKDGKLYVGGHNSWYQNLTTGQEVIVPYLKDTGLTNVIKIDAGYSNCSAMLSNGKTLCWGMNTYGALETQGSPTLQYVIAKDAVNIKLNGYHTIIQKENGEIYVTGYNGYGQFGLGDYDNRDVLTKIELPKDENGKEEKIKYISGTADNIMLMTKEGKIYVSGYNGYGQLCTGDTEPSNIFIPLVNRDGSIVTDCLLLEEHGENSNHFNDDRGLAFIREDGTVWISGDNSLGQMGNGTNDSTNYLTQYGTDTVILNKRNEYIKIGESIDIDVLEASEFNVFIKDVNQNEWNRWESSNEDVATVDANGIVTGVGIGHTTITAYNETNGLKGRAIINVYRNEIGAITVPQVSHGEDFTVVLKEDGTVWTSGDNTYGQLGAGEDVGAQCTVPVQVKIDANTYLTNVRKISVGIEWATALTLDGKVYTWGYNGYGQLAVGDTENLLYAKQAKIDENTYIENAIDISAGGIHLMVVTNDGSCYIAGYNGCYQNLTTGGEEVVPYLKDTRLTNVIKVDAGYANCSAMLSNGKTLGWGENYAGALETQGNPSLQYVIADDAVDIKLNAYHTVIQKENGEIYVSGYNGQGQLGLGDNDNRDVLTKVELPKDENEKEEKIKYISGTTDNIMLMTKEGKIYVSGYNGYGQLCTGNTDASNIFIPLVNRDGSKVTDSLLLEEHGENANYGNDDRGLAFIKEDGTVWISGDNTYGQMGNGTNDSTNYLTQYGTTAVTLNKRNEYIKVGESIDIDVLETSGFNVFIQGTLEQNEWNRWTSSNEDVATVDANGIVTGRGVGYTTITAYNETNGLKGRAIINVYRNKEGAITVPGVSHGDSFTAVLKEDGTVWTTGFSGAGQLGDGTNVDKNEPVQVKIDENTYLTNVRKISVGTEYSSALTLDGKVYVWGWNNYGQLAGGDTETLFYAKQAKIDENTYIENAIDISAGDAHLMVATNDGRVYVSGNNAWCQHLTTGGEESIPYLKDTGLTDVIKVDAGYSDCSSMLSNGKTLCWGANAFGALETQAHPTLQYVIADDAVDIKLNAYHTIIRKENGEIYVTGRNDQGQLGIGDYDNRDVLTKVDLPKDENGKEEEIKYISGTAGNTMLMTKEGKIYVTGYNGYGQLCTGDTTATNIFIPLVNRDGSIVTDCLLLEEHGENNFYCGDDKNNGYSSSTGLAFIKKDGTVWISGDNSLGQMGNGTNDSTNYLTQYGTTAVTLNKRNEYIKVGESIDIDVLETSGFNVFIQGTLEQNEWNRWISSNEDVATVDANGIVTGRGVGYTTITAYNETNGLKGRAIINVYRNKEGAITVPQVSHGEDFTVVLKEDGTVWTSGDNTYGQLGAGEDVGAQCTVPVQVKINANTYLTNVRKIGVGREWATALTKDGKVYTWGYNCQGQLAQGDTENLLYAKQAKIDENTYIENAIDISAGEVHLMVVTNDGKVYVGGYNYCYQNLTTGREEVVPYLKDTGLTNAIKVDAGYSNCSAMLSNGKTLGWGHNYAGALETQADPTLQYIIADDAVDIKLNAYYAIIQKENGEIYATGGNDQGQFGLGDYDNRDVLTKVELPKDENGKEEKIKYISGTADNIMLMTKEGKIYVSGYNGYGQLCTGNTDASNIFIPLVNRDGSIVTDSLLLEEHAENDGYFNDDRGLAFIRQDGTVWISGDNTYGQMGNGTNDSTDYLTAMGTSSEISLNKRNEYIKIGETLDLDVSGGTSNFNVFVDDVGAGPVSAQAGWTWTSSNEDVATVDENGNVTGVGIGQTTITAYNANGLKGRVIINVYRNKVGAITVPQVSHGDSFTAVLKEDGTVWTTGDNNVGQLGAGEDVGAQSTVPVQVKIDENTYLTNVRKISVGMEYASALTLDGKVYVWGWNDYGQLAQGDTTTIFYAKQAKIDENTYIENAIDISAGDRHLMVVTNDGSCYVAGHNYWYQNLTTGREDVTTYLKDTRLTNVIKVDAGYENCSAMLSNGKTLCWGYNPYGALETQANPTLQYVIADDAVDIKLNAYYAIIQKENGEIYATGGNDQGQFGLGDYDNRDVLTKVELPKDENGKEEKIKYISGTADNIMLMTKEGKIYVSGYNGYGQLCTGDTESRNTFIPLVNKDGSIVTDSLLLEEHGENDGYFNDDRGLAFIRQDGTVWISGDNTYGQMGNGTNDSTDYLTAMGTSSEISLNKRNEYIKIGETLDLDVLGGVFDFNVFMKGVENTNQGIWNRWTSSNEDVATVDENGNVTGVGIGQTTITAYNANGLKGRAIINVYRNKVGAITVPQVSHGDTFTAVLKEDGTVWTTGANDKGQLGDGTNVNKNEPVQVKIDENTYLTNVRKISVGREWTSALTKDGKVYVWGCNDYGQLARGDTANLLYAKQAKIDENTYIENAIDISTGDVDLMVVTKEGKVYVAGHNYYYQNLTTGREDKVPYLKDTGLTDAIKVNAGYSNCSAMLSNGKTLAWGCNNSGALETQGNPTLQYVIAEDAVDIKLNGYYTIIQKENGEIYVTGCNLCGHFGLGDNSNRNILTKVELPKDENGNEEEIKYISGTSGNVVLMTKEGKIYVSGNNGFGQLCTGDKTPLNTLIPLVNKDGSTVTDCLLLEEHGENSYYTNNSAGLAFIRQDGTVWISGDNTYGQIGNGTNESTNYLTLMGYKCLDYEDKIIEVDVSGYQIDINKLKYLDFGMNVYNENIEYALGEIEYEPVDTSLIEVSQNGHITPLKNEGETELKIKDVTNGYETTIKVIVKVTETEIDRLESITVNEKEATIESENQYYVEIVTEGNTGTLKVNTKNNTDRIMLAGENIATPDAEDKWYENGELTEIINLPNEITEIPIIVETTNGTQIEYTLLVKKLSTNASIKDITVENGTYIVRATEDKENENVYIAKVKSYDNYTVTATSNNVNAKVSIEGDEAAKNTAVKVIEKTAEYMEVEISVESENGNTEKYLLKIYVMSRDTSLGSVVVNQEELENIDDVYTYYLKEGEEVAHIEISVAGNNANIEVEEHIGIGYLEFDEDITSVTIKIEKKIKVTSEDGTETKEYTLIILRKTQIIGEITTENYEEKHIATVTLYKTVGAPREIISRIQTNEDGTYVLDINEVGEYDLVIEKPGYLSYTVKDIEITPGSIVEIKKYDLIAGDVVPDGEIEIDDLVDMNDNVGEEITEENEEEKSIYDLNEDGTIDMIDRVILKDNYGKIAETVKWIKPNRRRKRSDEEDTEDEDNNTAKYNEPNELTSDVSPLSSQYDISYIASGDGTILLTRMELNYLICPIACDYRISSNYGYRTHPTTGEKKMHSGIDLVGEHHTEILSIAEGEVTFAGVQNGYGNCIEIKHIVNGETIYSFYAHLSRIDVKVGEKVGAGDVIGLEGGAETDPNHGTSTGHHLHFEIRTASGSGHSIDPTEYIKF